jgi:hypothetical protein
VTQPTGQQPNEQPPASPQRRDEGSGEDNYLNIAEMMIGTAMMFVGFLNVLLSISGGYEMAGVIPVLLYFAGLAIWAHATVVNPTIRYSVIIASITIGLAFIQYGEVLFWHKQVIFWGTVIMVGFFMFKSSTSKPT